MYIRRLALPALAVAVSLAVCGLASSASAEEVTVKVGHNRIEPAEVTVAVGDEVTWVNEEKMPGGHSVTADDGSFESPGLDVGETFSHTFTEPGRVDYKLREHPSATGTVVVE